MGYLHFRDNPLLTDLTEEQQTKITMLADDLEYQAQQSFHNDVCGCDAGRARLSKCPWHVGIGTSVYADEIIAMLAALGRIDLNIPYVRMAPRD